MNTIHILQEGGIGDLIISLPLIQNYLIVNGYKTKIFSAFPEIVSLFLPNAESLSLIPNFRKDRHDFDLLIVISDMLFFYKKLQINLPEKIQNLYDSWLDKNKDWKELLNRHPFKANEMAHKALSLDLTRWTLPFYFINKEYQPYTMQAKIEDIHIPERFITIHDGFDASCYYKFTRSTKSWDVESWEQFVKLFKKEYPDIHVIQLGGVKHQKIKGVDINFAGQLEFKNSLRYLKSSLLHIDGDSGLVHARRLFNKPSVVLFGPTNYKYFGYPENINITPNFCGDCWWINSDWMQNCKDKYQTPKCMDSIKPEDVFKIVKNML